MTAQKKTNLEKEVKSDSKLAKPKKKVTEPTVKSENSNSEQVLKTKETSKKTSSKGSPKSSNKLSGPSFFGKGKRKRSVAVAKIFISEENPVFIINEIDAISYFKEPAHYGNASIPLKIIKNLGADQNFSIIVKVFGSGKSSQSDSVKLAIAKSFASLSSEFKVLMRQNGLLTTDTRIVQPKKSGYKKARRKEQFSKR